MRATEEFTIGRVYRLLPKVLGQESISLWLNFGLFATAVDLLQVALQRVSGGPSLAGRPMAIAFFVAVFVATCFVHCAAVHAADMRLSGTPVQAIVALRAGLSRFWPYLGLSTLLSLVITFGLLMLIAPGLFAAVAFSLATPALVIRRAGVFDSLGASWTMTKGHRLEILGLMLVYGVVCGLVIAAVILPGAAVLYLTGLAGTVGQSLVALVINDFLTSFVLVVAGAISTVMFRLIEADRAAIPA
ncbi:MAG: hypothetical protein H6Q99_1962 [Proteobacteria bacterium]|nr:hypothetical protein [Pseudomonadota bacterium]